MHKIASTILITFIIGVALFTATQVQAATEFISIIDPDSGSGYDFDSLNSWESVTQIDLTATTTLVFGHEGIVGAIPDGSDMVGSNSGATASTTRVTATQILLYNIQGTFQSGEQIQVQGATSNYATSTDAGDSVIAVAQCRSTGGSSDTSAVTISGWTTNATNYIKAWTDPDDPYGRHNGKWDDDKYRLEITNSVAIRIDDQFVVVDGLQVFVTTNTTGSGSGSGINVSFIEETLSGYTVSNNIVKADISTVDNGFAAIDLSGGTEDSKSFAFNNIVYDWYNKDFDNMWCRGIYGGDGYNYFFNNTFYNNRSNIVFGSSADYTDVRNNIFYSNAVNPSFSDYGIGVADVSMNNITSDDTSPDSGFENKFVSFVDASNEDFHLLSADVSALNTGTSTASIPVPFGMTQEKYYDIDGTARGCAPDIGADEVPVEFVSTICETTGSGGDCADMDYSTLSTWESAVDSDITASTTRIFSGTGSGDLTGETVTFVYPNYATTTVTATVVATTSDQILISGIIGTTTPLVGVVSSKLWVSDGNEWTISGTLDELGASPIAIAKIDGSWSATDTTAVTIDDWDGTDSDNYIKIYTTSDARHNGTWDYTKYRLVKNSGSGIAAIFVREAFVRVDGLQIKDESTTPTSIGGLSFDFSSSNNIENAYGVLSNNIILGNNGKGGGTSQNFGVELWIPNDYGQEVFIYNNIFADFWGDNNSNTAAIWKSHNYGYTYAYNNTIYNSYQGIKSGGVIKMIAVNNLIASTTDPFNGTFAFGTDYNTTDIDDAPGIGDNNATSATFTFVDVDSYDFHLALADTGARNLGTNLTNDIYLKITDDIDGNARANGFDIGADEAPEPTYRSVGPSNTTALSTGSSTTMTINGVTATFSSAQPDIVGVGDVIQYDSDGNDTVDSLAFIFERISSTEYRVVTASGEVPNATAGDNDWQIYRAYTSLSNAENGIENAGIAATLRDFDTWSGGKDIVASNEIWHIACYADAPDTTYVEINGWTTGANNYIKIFTPVNSDKVGTSQRHKAKAHTGYYMLPSTAGTFGIIDIYEAYVRIEGIEIDGSASDNLGGYESIGSREGDSNGDIYLAYNLMHDNVASFCFYLRGGYKTGINYYVYNNILYNCFEAGIYLGYGGHNDYIYNNSLYSNGFGSDTIYNDGIFLRSDVDYVELINNLSWNNDDYDIEGLFNADVAYNNVSGDETGDEHGTGGRANQIISIVDPVNLDLHLDPRDNSALDYGTSTNVSAIFNDDIDGHIRRQWDAGADEASVDFVSTVMESGGTFTSLSGWESANQVDLTATTTAVFDISATNGYIPFNSSVTGATSGATASTTVVSTSSNQILLYNIQGTFQNGEDVELDGATSNNVTISNIGNPANAVAKIDGSWSSADENSLTISGWETGDHNKLKIYTTKTARHKGKWDDAKYVISSTLDPIIVYEKYTNIDGLQIINTGTLDYRNGIRYLPDDALAPDSNNIVSNCIIRSTNTSQETIIGINANNWDEEFKIYIINNIIYDYNTYGLILAGNNDSTLIFSNNTIYNNPYGLFNNYDGYIIARNNIIENSGVSDFRGNYHSASSNNISSDGTAPGSNSKTNASVTFVNINNRDFHLDQSDTSARNAGVDLSSDATSSFAIDIDGTARGGAWDIGADEAATEFVSSVMQSGGDYASLDSWEDTVATDLTASGTLVFSGTLTGTLDQGDSVTLYRGSTSTGVTGFVVATTSSQILVRGAERGWTSLGEVQPLIATNGDYWRLDASNYWTVIGSGDQLGAPVIAVAKIDGAWSATDTTAVNISGWTTGPGNYIKIYTTDTARHKGKWSYDDYRLVSASSWSPAITINEDYIWIDGLQIETTAAVGDGGGRCIEYEGSGDIYLSNNINRYIQIGTTGGNNWMYYLRNTYSYNAFVWNNIFYGGYAAINARDNWGNSPNIYVYNNTMYDLYYGLNADGSGLTMVAKNNIIASTTDPFLDTYENSSDYNATDNTDHPGLKGNNQTNQIFSFVSTSSIDTYDLHLRSTDTGAVNKGVNLTNDTNFPTFARTGLVSDIDRDDRSLTQPWDIGADETSAQQSNQPVGFSGPSSDNDTLSEGLIGHWSFDEGFGSTVADRTGNGHTGTWQGSGSHWTGSGRYGNAGKFNANKSDGVELADSDDFNFSDENEFTISAWVYATNDSSWGTIFTRGDINGGDSNVVYNLSTYGSLSAWRVELSDGTNGVYMNGPDNSIDTNAWQHIVMLFDGNNNLLQLYKNGNIIEHANVDIDLWDGDHSNDRMLGIGYENTSDNYYWNGRIDELRVYNRAITQREIALLFNEGRAAVEWQFRNNYKDSGSLCTINPSQCQNLTAGGSGNQFAKGYTEEGITSLKLDNNGYAYISDNDILDFASTSDFSIAATVKTSDTNTSAIIGKKSNYNWGDTGYVLGLDSGYGDGVPVLEMGDYITNNQFELVGNKSISDGKWHTIIAVFDEDDITNCKMYIDGIDSTLTASGTLSSFGTFETIYDVNIGRIPGGIATLEGEIDRVAIYHYAMTRADVLRETKAGASTIIGELPDKSDASGQTYDPWGGSPPIAYWKLDEMDGSTAYDYASSSLNGTWYGSGNHNANGKVGMGSKFNGADDYVDAGSANILDDIELQGGGGMTVSFWVNPDSNTNAVILAKGRDQGSTGSWTIAKQSNTNPARLTFWKEGSTDLTYYHNDTLENNTWQYITITWDGGMTSNDVSFYKNGQLITSPSGGSDGASGNTDASRSLTIGSNDTPNNFFDGKIDDVKIYNYIRTPAQIAWDYNQGKPILWLAFDENSSGSADGQSLLDFSGNGYNGTGNDGGNNTGLTWGTGKVNYGISFDDIDDLVSTTDIDAMDGVNQLSMSAWVKPLTLNNYDTIVSKFNSSDNIGYSLQVTNIGGAADDILTGITDDGSDYCYTTTSPLETNVWGHWMMVYDGTQASSDDRIEIYFNGVKQTKSCSGTQLTTTPDTAYTVNVGAASSGDRFSNATIDEVKIWNYSLTEEMIREEYNGGVVKFGN